MQLVTIENKSSVISDKECFNIAWANNYQCTYQFGRSPWNIQAHVQMLPKGMKPPVGAWNIVLLDHSPEAGALGFHEDEEGTEIPFSDVFCETAKEYGVSPCAVTSHEILEMLVDPDVKNVKTATYKNKIYIKEICDPVQGNDYDLGDPYGKKTGMMMSDFVYPSWFSPSKFSLSQKSYRRSIKRSFELSPEGYISIAPINEPENWSQIFGEKIDILPKWASRLPRIDN